MFKLNQSTSFFWPVDVMIPVDGGKFDKQTFDAEFKRLDQAQLKELHGRVERGEINDEGFAREVLIGWRGVSDNGEDVPFSETTLRQLLLVPGSSAGIVIAFTNAVSGLARKN